MGLYSGSGAPLTVTMVNGLTVSVTPQASAPPSSVTIAPSSTAQFAYQISDVPVGAETSCPTSEQADHDDAGRVDVVGLLPLGHRPVQQRDDQGVARLQDVLTARPNGPA